MAGRRLRAAPGEPLVEGDPDDAATELADRVVAAAGSVDRGGVWWLLRAMLAVVAIAYLVVDVVALLLDDGPDSHVAHHLGVFEVAYAVTLLCIAVRPARARALVPFTVVLAIGMVVFAVVDVAAGHAPAFGELSHVLELAGLVLVWLLATRRGWPGSARRQVTPAAR